MVSDKPMDGGQQIIRFIGEAYIKSCYVKYRYLRVRDGWLYLAVIMDLWDRKIIGWSISRDVTSTLVCNALSMAVCNRSPRKGLIFHSDQGIQYWGREFKDMLDRLCPCVRQSMSRKGNCWDNACAESFFKTLKTELYLSKGLAQITVVVS